jgi:hypothetical protein
VFVLAGEHEARRQEIKKAEAYSAPTLQPAAAPTAALAKLAAAMAAGAVAPGGVEELLKQLPPMPAGWKPGDPIPALVLQPAQLAAVGAGPAAGAVAQKRGAAPAAAVPQPEEPLEAAVPAKAAVPVAAVPAARPVSAAFNFALNPHLELVFGDKGEDESDDESEEDDDDSD